VISYVAGRTLTGSRYLSPRVIARMGELSARVSAALAGLSHPAAARTLQWDLQHATRVIGTLAPLETDPAVQNHVSQAVTAAQDILAPLSSRLPRQIGHFDITDDNILVAGAPGGLPDGVIDFGDTTESWAIGELAVTISSVLHHSGATPLSALPAIRAFHALRPLSSDEADALWPLVMLRGAVLVLSGRQQVRIDTGNTYASEGLDREFRILTQATSVPSLVMARTIRHAVGLPVPAGRPAWTAGPVLEPGGPLVMLDAGTTAPVNDEGAWMRADALDVEARRALDRGAAGVIVPAGAPVLAGAPARTPAEPATIPTAATVWLANDTPLTIPGGARVTRTTGELTIACGDAALTFAVPAGEQTPAAEPAVLPARMPIQVTLTAAGATAIPARVEPGYAPAWMTLIGDPNPALGFSPAPGATSGDVLARREHVLAEVQEHYYARPPQIERGWREYLIDIHGRVYLDMVNNVTSVGHAHPRIADAAARQLRLLNTNSRFNYSAITEYAERIADTLPGELDTVFLVNSGSEATDLAIRLAVASTGRTDIVAMRESYHGWTFASDAVSTSIADNPQALATRPRWVHTVEAANSYRGIHRDCEAARYSPEATARIRALAAEGIPIAGFICESYFGNAGGVALPDGYLQQVYQTIRSLGGVAIADEVQVGYGRLGEWFWGFEQQGVVPDIVAVAKSIGNGHPIGAVITRRAIADRYRTQGYFFSSTGGSPLSSVVGMTVLDIIQRERLQDNARTTGAHLKHRLEDLARRHRIIGKVHGSGLYLGLEFVRDHDTLEPATEETAAICDRLLEQGVIMQPTGDHQNVLKIKPPLCVTLSSVDYFADQLDHILTTGW
jgi:4-aminobutyrate aminotransferase-like enzyme/Ser/Thr protein kinase RdoA (MazF antagonist)